MDKLKMILRGMKNLPHVGRHPGTGAVLILIFMGGMAGISDGIKGALIGAGLMVILFVPIYLWGAYDRARISEKCEREIWGDKL